MAPEEGLEPTIQRLTAACLAIRPFGNIWSRMRVTLPHLSAYEADEVTIPPIRIINIGSDNGI